MTSRFCLLILLLLVNVALGHESSPDAYIEDAPFGPMRKETMPNDATNDARQTVQSLFCNTLVISD